jgi:hypothetical protein
MQPDLEALEAAHEQAWLEYNHLQRELPRCEHVLEWQRQVDAARKAHRAALKAFDAAAWAPEPVPVSPSLPVSPEPETGACKQAALFEFGTGEAA